MGRVNMPLKNGEARDMTMVWTWKSTLSQDRKMMSALLSSKGEEASRISLSGDVVVSVLFAISKEILKNELGSVRDLTGANTSSLTWTSGWQRCEL